VIAKYLVGVTAEERYRKVAGKQLFFPYLLVVEVVQVSPDLAAGHDPRLLSYVGLLLARYVPVGPERLAIMKPHPSELKELRLVAYINPVLIYVLRPYYDVQKLALLNL
jgi:hypothetical protein